MDDIEKVLQERFLLQKEYLEETKPINDIVPLVSVTVATYQHVNYIKECLEGILKQQTDFPYEIIVGEDGSVDGTQEICKEYANRYPDKIRLFIRDRRLSQYVDSTGKVTRFNGIWNRMSCRGKYIAWCEGDDYWTDPLKLQKQVDFLETHSEYGLVYTNLDFYYQSQNRYLRDYITFSKNKQPESFIDHLSNAGYIAPCTWLFRRKYIDVGVTVGYVDGTFPLALDIWSDSKVYFMNDNTAVYRVLSESASHSKYLKKRFYFGVGLFRIQQDYIKKCRSLVSDVDIHRIYTDKYIHLLPSAIVLGEENFINEARGYFKKNLNFRAIVLLYLYKFLFLKRIFGYIYRWKGLILD